MLAGVREGGGRISHVPVYEDEPSAVRGELTDPGRAAGGSLPGVLVVMCHADRQGVRDVLLELGATAVEGSALASLAIGPRGR